MDPRFMTVAPTPLGVDLRCENCKTVIVEGVQVKGAGLSLFDLVRDSLRHTCASEDVVEHEEDLNALEGD